jgi:hypothetical protein
VPKVFQGFRLKLALLMIGTSFALVKAAEKVYRFVSIFGIERIGVMSNIQLAENPSEPFKDPKEPNTPDPGEPNPYPVTDPVPQPNPEPFPDPDPQPIPQPGPVPGAPPDVIF